MCNENTNEVSEKSFPDTKLKLVHKIYSKSLMDVKPKC
jgi:hypothetical protein